MNDLRIIKGANEEDIWLQVSKDLAAEDILEYNVIVQQGTYQVEIDVDIDLGGGFEGGFELTTLRSVLNDTDDFRFAIHKEHFIDEIGKFFGMQDVIIGYPEFDKHVIIKTNSEEKVKALFADEQLRTFLQSLEEDFTLGIATHHHQQVLEFSLEKGVTDPTSLRQIYHYFYSVLTFIDAAASPGATSHTHITKV
jgi:hypothetical protein